MTEYVGRCKRCGGAVWRDSGGMYVVRAGGRYRVCDMPLGTFRGRPHAPH